jgi:hypothetical protein
MKLSRKEYFCLVVRKFVASLLLVLYLLPAEGIHLHRHFCSGEVAAISYFSKTDEKDCCGEDRCDDCCYDDRVVIKLSADHVLKSLASIQLEVAQVPPTPTSIFIPIGIFTPEVNHTKTLWKSVVWPPPEPRYLTNCSWLI